MESEIDIKPDLKTQEEYIEGDQMIDFMNDPNLDIPTNSCRVCKYKCVSLPSLVRHTKSKTHQTIIEGKINKKDIFDRSLPKRAVVKKSCISASLERHTLSFKHKNALLLANQNDSVRNSLSDSKFVDQENSEEQGDLEEMPEDEEFKRKMDAYCCNTCGKKFKFAFALYDHLKTHQQNNQPSLITCEICQKIFTTYNVYRTHIKSHFLPPGSKKLFCSKCFKTFDSRREIGLHISRDKCESIKTKVFKCNVCDHSFKEMEALKAHKETHCEENVCKHCNKSFSNPESFKRHLALHQEEFKEDGSFPCTYCGKSFKLRHILRLHLNKFCPNSPKCNECGTFATKRGCEGCASTSETVDAAKTEPQVKGSLNPVPEIKQAPRKMQKISEGSYQCRLCPKTFPSQPGLSAHQRVHKPKDDIVLNQLYKSEHLRSKRIKNRNANTPKKRLKTDAGHALDVHFLDDFIKEKNPDEEVTEETQNDCEHETETRTEYDPDSILFKCLSCKRNFPNLESYQSHRCI